MAPAATERRLSCQPVSCQNLPVAAGGRVRASCGAKPGAGRGCGEIAMRIIDVCEVTKPIASPIRNAYIDFSQMTASLVAIVTDAVRDGRRVVGYGFNSNGRYGQGGLIRERFRRRILEAPAASLLNAEGDNLD